MDLPDWSYVLGSVLVGGVLVSQLAGHVVILFKRWAV